MNHSGCEPLGGAVAIHISTRIFLLHDQKKAPQPTLCREQFTIYQEQVSVSGTSHQRLQMFAAHGPVYLPHHNAPRIVVLQVNWPMCMQV